MYRRSGGCSSACACGHALAPARNRPFDWSVKDRPWRRYCMVGCANSIRRAKFNVQRPEAVPSQRKRTHHRRRVQSASSLEAREVTSIAWLDLFQSFIKPRPSLICPSCHPSHSFPWLQATPRLLRSLVYSSSYTRTRQAVRANTAMAARTAGGNAAFHNFHNDYAHIADPNERRRLALAEIDKVWRRTRF